MTRDTIYSGLVNDGEGTVAMRNLQMEALLLLAEYYIRSDSDPQVLNQQ
jgi:hypothetical protein